MSTQFSTGLAKGQDGYLVGKEAAQKAKNKMKEQRTIDLIILFCSNQYDYEAVMRGIQEIVGQEAPIVGCSSAGQFSEEDIAQDGVCCALIASDTHRFFSEIGVNLKSDPIKTLSEAVRSLPSQVEDYPHRAAMLFVDGLAGKGEETVLAAASILGPEVRFVGGAAADNLNFKETVVFGQNKALIDAVSLCLITSKRPVIISIKHGHKPVSPPLKITKAKGNILYEVEGKPALEVWKHYLRDHLKNEGIEIDQLNPEELSRVLLKYEAGLMTGTDYKIRFPSSCNPDGSFNFVCSLLEGSVIKIMSSEEKDQIESAREAARLALSAAEGIPLAGAIIFDCACRAVILKKEFVKAVRTNNQVLGDLPFIGCETYGEIAMDRGQLSGFHNTTTVLMLLPA